jgi:hypothetical protein
MPQQACIFCERPKPLVTITKEHLFSRWVDDVLTPEMLGTDRSYERTTAGPDGLARTKTWPTEVIAAIEAPVVCGNSPDGCNGGWMSGLDGQVKHLLRPMMLGQPRTLAPVQQLTIATWAVMKSMVLEYVWGTRPGRCHAAGSPYVCLPQPAPAGGHADPDRGGRVAGTASTHHAPRLPASGENARKPASPRVRVVLDAGTWLLRYPDIRRLGAAPRCGPRPTWARPPCDQPAYAQRCQLAAPQAA